MGSFHSDNTAEIKISSKVDELELRSIRFLNREKEILLSKSSNVLLDKGEMVQIDYNPKSHFTFKIGDGITKFNELPYFVIDKNGVSLFDSESNEEIGDLAKLRKITEITKIATHIIRTIFISSLCIVAIIFILNGGL